MNTFRDESRLHFLPGMSRQQSNVYEIAAHLVALMEMLPDLNPFGTLIKSPSIYLQGYVPGMPSSSLESLMEILRNGERIGAYECPNGHLYLVAN